MIRPHRVDQAEFVDHLGRMRQHIRHPHPRFAMPREFVLPSHHDTDITGVLIADCLHIPGKRFAIHSVERWLGIKQVHLTRPTVHKKLNDRCGFGRMLWWLGFEIVDARGGEG